jgi:hypothetical protein
VEQTPGYAQACAILYDGAPGVRAERLDAALRQSGARECAVALDESARAAGQPVVRGRVRMDGHEIRLVLVAAPADDEATRVALREALLTDEERQALLAHRAYIHCLYARGSANPLDQLRALYRVAGALVMDAAEGGQGARALGLVDVPALHAFTAPDLLALTRYVYADPPPIDLWVRLVGVSGQRGDTWLLTRGLAHFGKPELAISGRHAASGESAEALLMSVASWIISGTARVGVGDTLEMLAEEEQGDGVSRWTCRAPSQDERWLAAPFGTLILAPAGE